MNNTNTEVWPKEKSIDPYIAKVLFPQVDEGFWLASYTKPVVVSDDIKISKLGNIVLFNFALIDYLLTLEKSR